MPKDQLDGADAGHELEIASFINGAARSEDLKAQYNRKCLESLLDALAAAELEGNAARVEILSARLDAFSTRPN